VVNQEAVDTQNLERLVRDIGQRWGARLKAQYVAAGRTLGNWPGTLDDARRLVDSAAGPVGHDERELLALLVERGARRAWHSTDPVALDQSEGPAAPNRSGVMMKPAEWPDAENVEASRKAR
jgi:hypothetical protein